MIISTGHTLQCNQSEPLASKDSGSDEWFLSLPILSRCPNLGIARAAPPCTSGSANDWRRTWVIAMLLHQGIGTSRCFDVKNHRRYIAEQSANIRRGTRRLKMSQIHRRHIGDTSATHRRCSCKHRRCIFYVIISPMVWWSIADSSPMFQNCSAEHRRCYGDVSLER